MRLTTSFMCTRLSAYPRGAHRNGKFYQAAAARTTLAETVKCVVFMASDDAAFMTGSAVVMDSGFSLMYMFLYWVVYLTKMAFNGLMSMSKFLSYSSAAFQML
ncbi:hypothetical protein F4860DRAFT_470923 [Xylaria cubensis]|nr:hypothetical protein F4860DRAFT_470923 [Xylaria cubensis]